MFKTKKHITIGIAAVLASAALWLALSYTLAPGYIANAAIRDLNAISTQNIAPPQIEKSVGAIRIKDIALDTEARSTIGEITIYYNPLTALLTQKPTRIEITDLFLSGDIDANGALSIAGLKPAPAGAPLPHLKTGSLRLNTATLSLLTAQLGGIRLTADLTADTADHETVLTGRLRSKQAQFEIIAALDGRIAKDRNWQATLTIDSAKVERDYGKATRINGDIRLTGRDNALSAIDATMNAGGMVMLGLPWQNASFSANGPPDHLKLFLTGKSPRNAALELGVEGILKNDDLTWNARIFAESLGALANALAAQNRLPINRDALSALDGEKNIEITLAHQRKQGQDNLIFDIKKQSKNIHIKGRIQERPGDAYGDIYKVQFRSNSFRIEDLDTTPRALSGFATLIGTLTMSTGKLINGGMKIDVSQLNDSGNPALGQDMDGSLLIDEPRDLTATQDAKLDCQSPCSARLHLKSGRAVILKE